MILFITVIKKKNKRDMIVVDDSIQDLVFKVSDILNRDKALSVVDYIADIDLTTKIVRYHVYNDFVI